MICIMLSFFWGVDHPLGPSAYAAFPVLMMMMMIVACIALRHVANCLHCIAMP